MSPNLIIKVFVLKILEEYTTSTTTGICCSIITITIIPFHCMFRPLHGPVLYFY